MDEDEKMDTNSKKKGPLYYTVKEDLKDQIRKGELKKGDVKCSSRFC